MLQGKVGRRLEMIYQTPGSGHEDIHRGRAAGERGAGRYQGFLLCGQRLTGASNLH